MKGDVIPLRRAPIPRCCEKCGRTNLQRSATKQSRLWTLVTRCIMCGWAKTTPNVKAVA